MVMGLCCLRCMTLLNVLFRMDICVSLEKWFTNLEIQSDQILLEIIQIKKLYFALYFYLFNSSLSTNTI